MPILTGLMHQPQILLDYSLWGELDEGRNNELPP